MTQDFYAYVIEPEDEGFVSAAHHFGRNELDKILAGMAKVYQGKIKFNSWTGYDRYVMNETPLTRPYQAYGASSRTLLVFDPDSSVVSRRYYHGFGHNDVFFVYTDGNSGVVDVTSPNRADLNVTEGAMALLDADDSVLPGVDQHSRNAALSKYRSTAHGHWESIQNLSDEEQDRILSRLDTERLDIYVSAQPYAIVPTGYGADSGVYIIRWEHANTIDLESGRDSDREGWEYGHNVVFQETLVEHPGIPDREFFRYRLIAGDVY